MFVHRQAVVDLAATHRIAAVYELQVFVENGGLMSYGVDVPEMERRAAAYVDISKHVGRVKRARVLV
jgi:putative ABC transport system substrate-binding protein